MSHNGRWTDDNVEDQNYSQTIAGYSYLDAQINKVIPV